MRWQLGEGRVKLSPRVIERAAKMLLVRRISAISICHVLWVRGVSAIITRNPFMPYLLPDLPTNACQPRW